MEGTNVELGQKNPPRKRPQFHYRRRMKDGAQKVVALAGGAR